MRVPMGFLFLLASATLSHAEKLVWKTVEAGEWIELSYCNPKGENNCHDMVPYLVRMPFGTNMYFTYLEGIRASIGFGTIENQQWWGFADAMHPGAYDWGGTIEEGTFVPRYVIKRFYGYDTETMRRTAETGLITFRLLNDGTSCMVDTLGGTNVNGVARLWAERDADSPACIK